MSEEFVADYFRWANNEIARLNRVIEGLETGAQNTHSELRDLAAEAHERAEDHAKALRRIREGDVDDPRRIAREALSGGEDG